MPLEEYRRKRDFKRTPEPAGDPAVAAHRPPPGGSSSSAIERPASTTTSGSRSTASSSPGRCRAVPASIRRSPQDGDPRRGPPDRVPRLRGRDPEGPVRRRRRHRLGLGHLAGRTGDARTGARGVADGEVKFRLDGQKLQGRFTIVRTSGRGGRAFEDDEAEQWLLIHKKDEHAVAGWDAEDYPQSVKTGRTQRRGQGRARRALDQRGAGGRRPDRPWRGDRDADARLHRADGRDPRRPGVPGRGLALRGQVGRLPARGPRSGRGGPHVHPQRQGRIDRTSRASSTRRPGSPRARRSWTARSWRSGRTGCPTSRSSRNGSGSRGSDGRAAPELVYQVFDLLYLDGRSLLQVPLEDRKRLLRSVIRENARVRFASHVETEGVAFLEACAAQGLEGAIAKHRRSRYEPGHPVPRLAEAQDPARAGARRRRLDPRRGERQGPRCAGRGLLRGGRRRRTRRPSPSRASISPARSGPGSGRRRGRSSSGASPTSRPTARRSTRRRRRTTRAAGAATSRRSAGSRPELVIRAELGGWSRDGIVRQGAFKGIEAGRDPLEVVRERAVESRAAVRAVEAELPAATDPASATAAAARGPQPRPTHLRDAPAPVGGDGR